MKAGPLSRTGGSKAPACQSGLISTRVVTDVRLFSCIRAHLGPASDGVTAYSAWCNVRSETVEPERTPLVNASSTSPVTSPELVPGIQANLRGPSTLISNSLERGNLVPSELNEAHQDTDSDDDMQSVATTSDEPMAGWFAPHGSQQPCDDDLPGGMPRMTGQRRSGKPSEEFWMGRPQVKIVSDDFCRVSLGVQLDESW